MSGSRLEKIDNRMLGSTFSNILFCTRQPERQLMMTISQIALNN